MPTMNKPDPRPSLRHWTGLLAYAIDTATWEGWQRVFTRLVWNTKIEWSKPVYYGNITLTILDRNSIVLGLPGKTNLYISRTFKHIHFSHEDRAGREIRNFRVDIFGNWQTLKGVDWK
jgi:hypothetical protein